MCMIHTHDNGCVWPVAKISFAVDEEDKLVLCEASHCAVTSLG
jgi:hypothetical protein